MAEHTDELLVQVIHRLDNLNQSILSLLQFLQEPQQQAEQMPGVYTEAGMGILLNLLVASGLPSNPAQTKEFTVNAVSPTLLYGNTSRNLQYITITNDDPAQPIWIGDRNVSLTMGEVLLAQNRRPFAVIRGSEVYAICAIATLSVRVSEGFDIVGILNNIGLK